MSLATVHIDQRTDPNLRDLNAALIRRNVSFSDILDYVNEVEPNPLMVDVPRFPACPQKILEQLTIAENGGTLGDKNEILHTETEGMTGQQSSENVLGLGSNFELYTTNNFSSGELLTDDR